MSAADIGAGITGVATTAFWCSGALIAYSYIGYPVLLWLISRVAGRRFVDLGSPEKSAAAIADLPTVDVLVAAYNEESHIADRIRNILSQDYPQDRLGVMVGSDGSADRTASIATELSGPRVRVLDFEHNRGKASVLNDLVATSTADILVFTDANTSFSVDAVRVLASRFGDLSIAGVCGELRLLAATGSNQDSLYWRLEQFMKEIEGQIGGLLGANGGIYAIRRKDYQPLPPDTIVDDFCVAMTAACRSGGRLDYDARALATEDTPPSMADEYRRRVRIGIGNYQVLFRHPEYLYRLGPITTLTYVSHKVLRWLGPHLLLVALISSVVLAGSGFFAAMLGIQLLSYAAVAVAVLRPETTWRPAPVRAIVFTLTLNVALLMGFIKYVKGDYAGSWQRSRRA